MDDLYVLGQLDILGDLRAPSVLPVREQAGFDPLFKWDSPSPLVYGQHYWWIRWVTIRYFVGYVVNLTTMPTLCL